jgi:Arc/MetJ family transcription regulator
VVLASHVYDREYLYTSAELGMRTNIEIDDKLMAEAQKASRPMGERERIA